MRKLFKNPNFLTLLVVILIIFLFFFCHWSGYLDDFLAKEKDKTNETEEDDEDEYVPPEPTGCIAPYTKTVQPDGDILYTATNQADLTRIDYNVKIQGWMWQAVWGDSVHSVSWISDEYFTKGELLGELLNHYNNDEMRKSQYDWYDCMLTEKL